jgi:general L-amino acid transport system substrate-binding protein
MCWFSLSLDQALKNCSKCNCCGQNRPRTKRIAPVIKIGLSLKHSQANHQEEVKMKKTVLFGTLAAVGLAAGMASAGTLDDVKAKGELACGVSTGVPGFAFPDAEGNWQGFDVAICRAVAAAVLLSRNTTWTFSRDVDLKQTFLGVDYYDGQGFMVRVDLGVTSLLEMDGATICIQTGTTTELNLADYFRTNGMTYEPVPIDNNAEAQQQYLAGACDSYTTLNALITAEELGITQANVVEMSQGHKNSEINRMLGNEGSLAAQLGLESDWAVNAILAGGNYGEIFSNNVGENSPIGLSRGVNALWTDGGLIYSPPFR